MKRIGVIAGRGNFPIIFSQEARKAGYKITAVGVRANTKCSLKYYVDEFCWLKIQEFNRLSEIFKRANISKVVMAGQINPYLLFNRKVMSSPAAVEFFGRVDDRRADTIFNAFAKKLKADGLELLDSTLFLDNFLPGKAVLTKRVPDAQERKDIEFGLGIAKVLGSVDIGQTVCVKKGVILAAEAVEGTDNTIRRAKALSKGGIVLVKVSKPNQDSRFDVPVVGFKTIKNLPISSCLAIEAKKTLFFNQREAIRLADRKNITISAV